MTPTSRRRPWVALLAGTLVVAACSQAGGDDGEQTATDTTTTAVITTLPDAPAVPSEPLTGVEIDADDPLLSSPAYAVKVGNNDRKAYPQSALDIADIVYEELIEDHRTRLVAVYHSELPETVVPVRSARSTDFDLLIDLGQPVFINSGANPWVRGEIEDLASKDRFVDAQFDANPSAFERVEDRFATNGRDNALQVTIDDVQTRDAGSPNPIFAYRADGEPAAGRPTGGVSVVYDRTPGRDVRHLWDADVGGWVRIQDGDLHRTTSQDGELVEIAPENVVVLSIEYVQSQADPDSPRGYGYGEGDALVFTGGNVIQGAWIHAWDAVGWQLSDRDGAEIRLTPGRTWVLLANRLDGVWSAADISVLAEADATSILELARETAKSEDEDES